MVGPGLKLLAGLAAVFLLGAATGAALMRAADNRRVEAIFAGGPLKTRQALLLWDLEARLDLSAAQRDEIARLIDEQVAENSPALRLALVPLMKRSWATLAERIRPLLDEQQQAELERWRLEREARLEKSLEAVTAP
jgi:hypothetical protein